MNYHKGSSTQKLERVTSKMKKMIYNHGSKDGEERNNVKDHNIEDNEEDYREAPLNVSAEKVFFTKEVRLSSSVSKEQDPKKLMVLEVNLHFFFFYQMFYIQQHFIMTPPPSHRPTHI